MVQLDKTNPTWMLWQIGLLTTSWIAVSSCSYLIRCRQRGLQRWLARRGWIWKRSTITGGNETNWPTRHSKKTPVGLEEEKRRARWYKSVEERDAIHLIGRPISSEPWLWFTCRTLTVESPSTSATGDLWSKKWKEVGHLLLCHVSSHWCDRLLSFSRSATSWRLDQWEDDRVARLAKFDHRPKRRSPLTKWRAHLVAADTPVA